MFIKNCWYVAAWDYELIDGKLLARTILNERVLLYRGDSGEVIALNVVVLRRSRLMRLGLAFRRTQHDLAVDREGLQQDVETFSVLVHEGRADIEPEVILAFSFDDGVRLIARLLFGSHTQLLWLVGFSTRRRA